jgi:hypothetical protein
MHDALWLCESTCFEPRAIVQHQIGILAGAVCGHARDFFFCRILSMSDGEEGVLG